MEFTPRKGSRPFAQSQNTARHGSHSSDGKIFLKRFNKQRLGRAKPYSEPPQRLKNSSTNQFFARNSKRGLFPHMTENKPLSRGESFLKASQSATSPQSSGSKSIYDRLGPSPNSKKVYRQSPEPKRPSVDRFRSTPDFMSRLKRSSSADRTTTTVFSDSDDELLLSSKYDQENNLEERKSNSDKENDDGTSPIPVNFYSKRKIPLRRTSVLSDISPAKVEKAYGNRALNLIKFESSKTGNGKINKIIENDSNKNVIAHSAEIIVDSPHEIGFLNYGNTCYLNAVLQSLLGLQPFISDIDYVVQGLDVKPSSITHSLGKVIVGRHNTDVVSIRKSLRHLKENLERIDGSFSGFKMQDANEFLTQVLDTVKDEINHCFTSKSENAVTSTASESTLDSVTTTSNINVSPCASSNNLTDNVVPNECHSLFDTPQSNSQVSLELRLRDEGYTSSEDCEITFKQCPEEASSKIDIKDNSSDEGSELSLLTKSTDSAMEAEMSTSSSGQLFSSNEESELENPINKNFEFELLESYRCLGCGHVEGRKQSHYALYVNLPKESEESIQEAVNSYMGEDHRDLTCSKCSHEKVIVTTRFTKLPRVLIVQIKRYEYKQDQFECIKVSSRVSVDMNLSLDNLSIDDATFPCPWEPRLLTCTNDRNVKPVSSSISNCPVPETTCTSEMESVSEILTVDEDPVLSVPSQEFGTPQKLVPLQNLDTRVTTFSDEKVTPEKDTTQDTQDETMPLVAADTGSEPGSETDLLAIKSAEETEKEKEEKELQEVMLRSLEDQGPQGDRSNPESEEEEIQKAIRLSLQDMGMCYASDDNSGNSDKVDSDSPSSSKHGEEVEEGDHSYRLLSLISHFGLTTCTGHYVSDVYNCNKSQWFHYDDEVVAKLQEAVVLAEGRQKNGYIFFYVHKDIYQQLGSSPL